MPLQPIYLAPGISKSQSAYALAKPTAMGGGRVSYGRYIDGNNVRFVDRFPEKIAGFTAATSSKMTDVPRASTEWRDKNAAGNVAFGTGSHLYTFDSTTLLDITPQRTIVVGTFTNQLTTTNASTTVAVADAAQTLQNGDWVFISAPSTVGGLTINGWYQVLGRTGSGYNIITATAATSGQTGGGLTAFDYPRTTLTNPFATTNGSPTVTVTHVAHGATTGDYVTFSGASAVAGLTLNGEFQLTVVNANSYTITASSNANATTTGGGSVSVTYNITLGQSISSATVTYGQGAYGEGSYGYGTVTTASSTAGWTIDAYGASILAAPIGGTIYMYSTGDGRAHPVLNAPASVAAIFVTPERFLFALTQANGAMQVMWPDQNDITNWVTLPTNTANSGRPLQGGNNLVAGKKVAFGLSLFWSNGSTFIASYIGGNSIYSTQAIADHVGLIGPWAATTMNGAAFWMASNDFYMYNGSITALPSDDIREFIFGNLNRAQQWKVIAGTVAARQEVWFFIPTGNSAENGLLVIWHIQQQCWSLGSGSIVRSAWNDSSLFSNPIGADTGGNIYLHETGTDANGVPLDSYLTTAMFDVSNGDRAVDIFGFIPDFQRQTGQVTLTVYTAMYPQDPPSVAEVVTITADDTAPLLDLRDSGKLFGFKLDSNTIGADYRIGLPRVEAQPAGARR